MYGIHPTYVQYSPQLCIVVVTPLLYSIHPLMYSTHITDVPLISKSSPLVRVHCTILHCTF